MVFRHLLNDLLPLTLIGMKGLCVCQVYSWHIIFATSSGELNMAGPSIPPSNSHTDLCTQLTVHRLISGIYIQRLAIYSPGCESTAVPARPAASVICIAGRLSERLSLSHRMPMSSASGALADSLAFWLRRNQSDRQLLPKSHYPPCLTTCQSPLPPTSLFSLT